MTADLATFGSSLTPGHSEDDVMRDVASAVDLLPALPPPDPDDRYHVRNLTVLWLLRLSETSRRGYYQALADWLSWCQRHGVDPLDARRADRDGWQAGMTSRKVGPGNVVVTIPASPATVAKRLAVVSSWYSYLNENDIDVRNPAAGGRRPKPPSRSRLPALSAEEMTGFIDWLVRRAQRLGTEAAWRDAAHLHLLFATGLRVTASCTAEFSDIRFESGYCVLYYRKKSRNPDDWDFVPLSEHVLQTLTRYWTLRARRESAEQGKLVTIQDLSGPLFVSTPHPHQPDRAGGAPLNQKHVQRRLRTLARQAGLKCAATITPHSTRRTAATVALANGATLAQVQDLLGHADPRTTRQGYDATVHRLSTSAVWTIADVVANGQRPTPET